MRRIALMISCLILCLSAAAPAPAQAEDRRGAKHVFGAASTPAQGAAQAHGGYAKGCLAGAEQLPTDGSGWSAMRLSRDRRWGHPALIAFIKRLGAAARRQGWNGVLAGDMSQPRGGPMGSGHRSHQTGLDVDIWLRPAPPHRPTINERERQSSIDVTNGRRNNQLDLAAWSRTIAPLIRDAAQDAAVARVFVNPAIKQRLCAETAPTDRAWLRKVRAWWGHDAHFHVRLRCPAGAAGCVDQAPPPAGDGCDTAELDWWFTEEPYTGASGPRTDLRMSDLPAACVNIAAAP